MGIDHVDRMFARKPAAKIPSPSDPSSWTAEMLAEYQADDGRPWIAVDNTASPASFPLCPPNPCVSPNMEAMQKVVEWCQENFSPLGAMKTYAVTPTNRDAVVTRVSCFNAEGQETVMFDGSQEVGAGDLIQWEWKESLLTMAPGEIPPLRTCYSDPSLVLSDPRRQWPEPDAPPLAVKPPLGPVVLCRTCWGLGFIPGASGRHITCEDCGYEEVEFK